MDSAGAMDAAGPTPPAATEADRVAEAARSAPTVAGLSGGPFGGTGTYLAGRRVTGVQLDSETVEVHVVGVYGHAVAEIAADVRRAVAAVAGGRKIDVVIEDLQPVRAADAR